MRRPGTAAFAVLSIAGLAACAAPPPTGPPARATTTIAPEPTTTIPASPTTSDRPSEVVVDPTLLDLLPAGLDGIERQADAETAAGIAASSDLAAQAAGVAVALYVRGPAASAEDVDYAVVTVTRLREGVFSEAFHRDWRDSFDAAVCDQAGGVIGNAEAEIGGHRTFIGTCGGGVRTYHLVLPETDTLISMQALGAGRLGERIVEDLPE